MRESVENPHKKMVDSMTIPEAVLATIADLQGENPLLPARWASMYAHLAVFYCGRKEGVDFIRQALAWPPSSEVLKGSKWAELALSGEVKRIEEGELEKPAELSMQAWVVLAQRYLQRDKSGDLVETA